jgi:DNA-binding NarL/FixJ family response regulator
VFTEGKAMELGEAVEYALAKVEETDPPTTSAPEEPSSAKPPVALTRREREVASLVAQGLTNRQIASELFISERTVDHHVEKILKKLDLSSREQVASRLAE